MLSMSGFPKEAITAAKSRRCEICVRVCAPRATPKVVPRRAERFNEELGADTFYIYLGGSTNDRRQWKVTHFVDAFSTLSQGMADMKITSDTATEAFHQTWLRAYGPPERLSVDAGGEFQGRFEEMCSIAGIELDVVPPNAKWRAGLAERHGSIAKLMLLRMNETLVLTEDWEVHIAVTCVFAAKNRLHRSAGWAP